MAAGVLDDPELRGYLERTVGDKGVSVAQILQELSKATDTEIAERLHEKPSHIRRILYDLYEARLAEYQKEKDKDTGWQTFIWHLTPDTARYALGQRKKREIAEIEVQLKFEEDNRFYTCPADKKRFAFEQAQDAEFHCPECSAELVFDDNQEVITALRAKLEELRAEAEEHSPTPRSGKAKKKTP
ncbi:MAG: transcription factor [Methanobacteriota archaeon]